MKNNKSPQLLPEDVLNQIQTYLDELIDEANYIYHDDLGYNLNKTREFTGILETIAKVYSKIQEMKREINNTKLFEKMETLK